MPLVSIGASSHAGVRKENQDYHAYYFPKEKSEKSKGILLALADGMGGRAGGSLASKIAVNTLIKEYYGDSTNDINESLRLAFLEANNEIRSRGDKDIKLQGMGTTLTAVVLKNRRIYYAHVGDSRAYNIDGEKISQITEDHSLMASLIKAGGITKEDAMKHPDSNVITRAVGIDSELKVDVSKNPIKIKKGQYILLCCDGLYRVVSDQEILHMVYEYSKPEIICEKLVEKAIDNGSQDNITVLLARVDKTNVLSDFIGGLKGLRGNRL